MPDLDRLKNWAFKLTTEAEAEALQAMLQRRYCEQWAMQKDAREREVLWLKIQLLNDLFAELRILAEGEQDAGD